MLARGYLKFSINFPPPLPTLPKLVAIDGKKIMGFGTNLLEMSGIYGKLERTVELFYIPKQGEEQPELCIPPRIQL